MNCPGSFPGYYFARDLIPGAVSIPWSPLNSDIAWRTGTGYNVPVQQPSIDKCIGYDKEVMKQTILRHEATFRYQVQELHRVYTRQKELMIELQRRYIQLQASQSNPKHFDVSRTTFSFLGQPVVTATGSDLSSLEPLPNPYPEEAQILSTKEIKFGKRLLDLELPGDQYIDSEEDEKIVEENAAEVLQIQCNLPKESLKLLIDLNEPFQLDESEIPLSFSHGDSDTSCKEIINLNQDLSQSPNKESEDSNCRGAYTFQAGQENDAFLQKSDLRNSQVELPHHNSEAGLDGAMLISQKQVSSTGMSPRSSVERTNSGSNISKKGHDLHVEVETSFSQSVEPKIKSLSSVSSNKRSIHDFKKMPVVVQALPCLDARSKHFKNTDHVKSYEKNGIEDSTNALEAPVSPENKECSPPRGESDDMQLEIPQTLVKEDEHPITKTEKVAAEAIISISSSRVKWYLERLVNMPPKPFDDCLEWFAGVVSSMAGNLGNEETAYSSLPRQRGRGKKAKQQRVVRKKAIHTLGMTSKATEVGSGKATKRKRIGGENDFSKRRLSHSIVDWFRKGKRRARRARSGFHDFPLLADLHDC